MMEQSQGQKRVMGLLSSGFRLVDLLCFICLFFFVGSSGGHQLVQPPFRSMNVTTAFERIPFKGGYQSLWGAHHQRLSPDGMAITLSLDKQSGSGFKSSEPYLYGYFSVAMKFPANNSAGVVATFYLSNNEAYKDTHDEIDFEFLGVLPGQDIVVQTNVYSNGSTKTGREQRYHLWFDPTKDFHHYSLLWMPNQLTLFVDDVPIRRYNKVGKQSNQYPSKPMFVYATLWDGSSWATNGGKDKINFSYAPFNVTYTNFVLRGCQQQQPKNNKKSSTSADKKFKQCLKSSNFISDRHNVASGNNKFPLITSKEVKHRLNWVHQNYLVYDYCNDSKRYPKSLPECWKN